MIEDIINEAQLLTVTTADRNVDAYVAPDVFDAVCIAHGDSCAWFVCSGRSHSYMVLRVGATTIRFVPDASRKPGTWKCVAGEFINEIHRRKGGWEWVEEDD